MLRPEDPLPLEGNLIDIWPDLGVCRINRGVIIMFVDTRRVENGTDDQTAVCIIGGGVAGITLALELEKQGIDACLLESGGFKPDDATRDLYRGKDIGQPYIFSDGCRGRFLGGSSNCWGGWCRPRTLGISRSATGLPIAAGPSA